MSSDGACAGHRVRLNDRPSRPPHPNQGPPELECDEIDEHPTLSMVDLVDGSEERHRNAGCLGSSDRHRYLVGQAGPAEADPSPHEGAADAGVIRHPVDDVGDIGIEGVAQRRQLVGEADLGRQEEVGAELRQAGVDRRHDEHRGV
jgi:hypothetical protein